MNPVRCTYCGRFYKKINKAKRCRECEEQYHSVFTSITKRLGKALKGLSWR